MKKVVSFFLLILTVFILVSCADYKKITIKSLYDDKFTFKVKKEWDSCVRHKESELVYGANIYTSNEETENSVLEYILDEDTSYYYIKDKHPDYDGNEIILCKGNSRYFIYPRYTLESNKILIFFVEELSLCYLLQNTKIPFPYDEIYYAGGYCSDCEPVVRKLGIEKTYEILIESKLYDYVKIVEDYIVIGYNGENYNLFFE